MKLWLATLALTVLIYALVYRPHERWFCRGDVCCLQEVGWFGYTTGCGSPGTCAVQRTCWKTEDDQ